MPKIDPRQRSRDREGASALEDIQERLVQSERMAAWGVLATGMAHEIVNPVTFISSGLQPLERDIGELAELIPSERRGEAFEKVRRRIAWRLDAIGDGAKRTAETVQELRSLSQVDEVEPKMADLQAMLDATLKVLLYQVRDRIEVVKHYGEIPPVECVAAEVDQVFTNLLLNAFQAIEDRGLIAVTTAWEVGHHVQVSIRDSGRGMPGEVLERIFDPFFTTKPLGQGTGLGLSISRDIVDRHRGRLEVASEPGEGTEVTVTLPILFAA